MVMGKGRGGEEEVSNVFSVKFSLSLATAASSLSMYLCRLTTRVAQTPSYVCIQQI